MRPRSTPLLRALATLLAGTLFGFGLSLSGMVRPEVVLAFLHGQDLGLLLVMGGAVLLVMVVYRLAPRLLQRPLLDDHFHVHPSVWSRDTALGAALFGIGRPLPRWARATGACCGRWGALRWARWCRAGGHNSASRLQLFRNPDAPRPFRPQGSQL